MLIRLYNENPNSKKLRQVVEILEDGGIIIYPTDTVYAMGCSINSKKGIERLARLKGVNPNNPDLSFIFHDMSQLAEYTIIHDNSLFKLLKRNLPGPFTFIIQANSQIPKLFMGKKKTVGIRIPGNNIIREIVRELGKPVITTSIHDSDDLVEYITDPELIHEKYQDFVDVVVDGGYGRNEASTIVDCTGAEIIIVRQGLGVLEF